MLFVEGLNVYYGESHILHNVDLKIKPGETACLLGRNGVGKTTTLKGVMGLLPARKGKITLDKQDVTKTTPAQRAKLGMGFVPQGRDIFPTLTVYENLLVALEARRDNVCKVPDIVFELFPILDDFRNRKGGDLSGGQQQQLSIGRALTLDPKLLILDEPTEGIQPSVIKEIEHVLVRIKELSDIAILMVEQYLEFAWRVADIYYIMAKGAVIESGSTREVDIESVQKHITI
jgi:urea transport system ATP-binding protein